MAGVCPDMVFSLGWGQEPSLRSVAPGAGRSHLSESPARVPSDTLFSQDRSGVISTPLGGGAARVLMAQALRGRDGEQAVLDRLLDDVRTGDSRVLVLRGEAGVGKTALLDCVQDRVPDCRVVR